MSFNEAQTEAIHHKEGPLLIIAGPGSGKTTVIVNRTKNLIEEHHIDPSKILVVTFTKSAAEEMGIRFQKIMSGRRGSGSIYWCSFWYDPLYLFSDFSKLFWI